jgi:transcriptional regulator with XRE-family HTH domain
MRLKEIRLAQGIKQPQIVEQIRRIEPRIQVSDISRYETYLSLPTPAQLQIICQTLSADPDEIYTKEEMDLAGCSKISHSSTEKQTNEPNTYKLTVRLPQALASGLKTKLAVCGYNSITGWITAKLGELDREYKNRLDAATFETAKKINHTKNITKEAS